MTKIPQPVPLDNSHKKPAPADAHRSVSDASVLDDPTWTAFKRSLRDLDPKEKLERLDAWVDRHQSREAEIQVADYKRRIR